MDSSFNRAQAAYDAQEPPEGEVFTTCDQCNQEIFMGEYFYHIDNEDICIDCLNDWAEQFKEIAGEE